MAWTPRQSPYQFLENERRPGGLTYPCVHSRAVSVFPKLARYIADGLVYFSGYYPQLIALYTRLGVSFREADFSYTFSLLSPRSETQNQQINATMIYNGSSGRSGLSMPSILEEPYHRTKGQSTFVRAVTRAWTVGLFVFVTMHISICYLRMLLYALPFWRTRATKKTFGEWAEQTVPTAMLAKWAGMDVAWRDYTHTVLLPLFSAVCTAPEEDVFQHPVEEFLGAPVPFHFFLPIN